MITEVDDLALLKYLKYKNAILFGKVKELRNRIQEWLTYIPQTFPHYTCHTVQHSDAIIGQMSSLLFSKDNQETPVVELSAVEAYIAIVSAYMHDAGMVCSDGEKAKIISSSEWTAWTTGDGPGAKRLVEISILRNASEHNNKDLTNFLADVQLRFLLAEYVRRLHHTRAKDLVVSSDAHAGDFTLGDPILARTIADVCEAHGLSQNDLEDKDRFPDRRDIQGQEVNVRFLAILLRLGDLLDLSSDRACPLLLNAACTLPSDSFAHWTQYQRLTHRVTAPDKIEITAECNNQDEHRFLKDWCKWLVKEVEYAAVLTTRFRRHHEWIPPHISIDCNDATIRIVPGRTAQYIPSSWTFELNPEAVFNRLIVDLYPNSNAYLRELMQNALDANRCQLFLDMVQADLPIPELPTMAAEQTRARYPVKVSLEEKQVKNAMSGEAEIRQVVTIEDSGLGMDRDVIQRYLLQVGRSYYTTSEFQKQFRFIPTSRFGVGFLSVFSVSDRIEIDTYKPSSNTSDGPLHLVLTGPRNYLLLEKGQRRVRGTKIQIFLRQPMERAQLTGLMQHWCRRVEFPVIVSELGEETVISAEMPEAFTYSLPDVTTEGGSFKVRIFDIARPGIEGFLFVFVHEVNGKEYWDKWNWSQYSYPSKHPQAQSPVMPDSVVCLHGIAESYTRSSSTAYRIDYRDTSYQPTMSREMVRQERNDPRVDSRWCEILTEHLNLCSSYSSDRGWEYKQRLVNSFDLGAFWDRVPETIPFYLNGQFKPLCLEEANGLVDISTAVLRPRHASNAVLRDVSANVNMLLPGDIANLSSAHLRRMFIGRRLASVLIRDTHLELRWTIASEYGYWSASTVRHSVLAELPSEEVIGFDMHMTIDNIYHTVLLNSTHGFVKWLSAVKVACERRQFNLNLDQFDRLLGHVYDAVRYGHVSELTEYVRSLVRIPEIPSILHPPQLTFRSSMFSVGRIWR
ncbi:MAG TPA: ATP-binding protein [Candidatus Angelobacter sp.]|nr:ATP-binding protein [Candidatus Angelobacter sp.]